LSKLATRFRGRVLTEVVVVLPKGLVKRDTTAVRAAASLTPGVHLAEDHNGLEATRFEVTTSGEVLLFDSDGNRRYQGGITASRGQVGNNLGADAIADIVNGGAGKRRVPTFGCALQSIEVEL
jgi:hypothetical protein